MVVQITRELCMQHVCKLDQNKVLAHMGKGQEWWGFLVFQSNVIYKNHEHILSRCQSWPSQSIVHCEWFIIVAKFHQKTKSNFKNKWFENEMISKVFNHQKWKGKTIKISTFLVFNV